MSWVVSDKGELTRTERGDETGIPAEGTACAKTGRGEECDEVTGAWVEVVGEGRVDGGWDHICQACQRVGIDGGIDFSLSSGQGIRKFLVCLGRIGARWVWEERQWVGGEGGGGKPEGEGRGKRRRR